MDERTGHQISGDSIAEDLWGYAKRLQFVKAALSYEWPESSPEQIRVLDVGCGNGSYLALPLALSGYRVAGLDVDERSIAAAKKLADGVPNICFVQGMLADLPRQMFDAVILSEVMEHVADPAALLREALSFLNANGIAVVTVPNGRGEFEIDSYIYRTLRVARIVDWIRGKSEGPAGTTQNVECGHIQFFTRPRLHRIFQDCGLRLIQERASSFLSGPFVGNTLAHSRAFIRWNARVADRLPLGFASGWYFLLKKALPEPAA